jgi:hypothetical protein
MLSASKSSSWPIGVGDQTVIIFETLSWTQLRYTGWKPVLRYAGWKPVLPYAGGKPVLPPVGRGSAPIVGFG